MSTQDSTDEDANADLNVKWTKRSISSGVTRGAILEAAVWPLAMAMLHLWNGVEANSSVATFHSR
ncbi:hypothetical protein [Allorhodopirellula heiligendammensis]|uniref:Uncharacterized protein n=1 Tax=Allorhodopirellula heiligendammensis TaxID=2714739 RepID=A0A5C6BUK0_9BACT|nr:hypothetical protein [Allorhodopirellula heiligendammensis]TWU15943.1 hypothetical protein Poly21_31470 [Allorhodopirellula heiligendammensis]